MTATTGSDGPAGGAHAVNAVPAGGPLGATWSDLEADAARRPGRGLVVRRVAPGSPADIYLGIERPSGARLVLVTVPASVVDPSAMDLACAGIDVRSYTLDPNARAYVTVGVRLTVPRYSDVFGALAADLVGHLAAVSSPDAAAPALFGRLQRWQQFLRRLDPTGLGAEAQRGLYAELRFLRDHAIPALGARPAVAGWTGPARADQDFQFGPAAVEVKSHAGHQPQEVLISSARQLDDAALACLLLFVVSLDVREGAGETLAAAVDGLRATLAAAPAALDLFETRLLEAGYLDAHRARYDEAGYTSRDESFYRVGPGFPRIVERDLIPGVGSVQYGIVPAACAAFLVTAGAIPALLRGEGLAAGGATAHPPRPEAADV